MYPPVEASSGQEHYYIRPVIHLLICCSAIGEVSHTFQCRRYYFLKLSNLRKLTFCFCCCWWWCCCCCCCCCCLILLLLFICNCGCTITDKQQQQNETVTTKAIRTKRLKNLCRLIFCCCCCYCVILLLFNCNCGCTMTDEQQQQQHYTGTTTKQRTKRSIYLHILCNVQELNWGGRLQSDISCSDLPPAGGIWWPRKYYIIRSSWHLVILQIRLTFCQMYPLLEASCGQEQYYIIRSSWHWVILQVRLTFCQMYPLVEASGCQEQYYIIRSSWHWVILWVRVIFSEMYPP